MEDIDIYLEAASINDEGRKKAIMLHLETEDSDV